MNWAAESGWKVGLEGWTELELRVLEIKKEIEELITPEKSQNFTLTVSACTIPVLSSE